MLIRQRLKLDDFQFSDAYNIFRQTCSKVPAKFVKTKKNFADSRALEKYFFSEVLKSSVFNCGLGKIFEVLKSQVNNYPFSFNIDVDIEY